MWDKFEKYDIAGIPMTTLAGYKFLALGFIVGIGAWVSCITLGDSAEQLLGFYDNYNPKIEGSTDLLGQDIDGTSIIYDLSYVTVTLLWHFFVTVAMAAGAYIVGIVWIETSLP